MNYEEYIAELKENYTKRVIEYVLNKKNKIKSKKIIGTKFTIKIVDDDNFIEKMNDIAEEIKYHTIFYIAKYGFDDNITYDKSWVTPSIKYFEIQEEYRICHLIQQKFINE